MIQWCDGPEAQRQPAARGGLRGQRLPGQRDRVLRLQRDDRGAELDPRRPRPHQGHRGQRVEVRRDLRHPRGVQARALGPRHVVEHPRDLARGVAPLRPDHHTDAHGVSSSWARAPASARIPGHQHVERRAGRVDGRGARGPQPGHVGGRDGAADDDGDVVGPGRPQALDDAGGQGQMRAGQDADRPTTATSSCRAVATMASTRWRMPVKMTSKPASRSARATILAPRSWPSRPGLATRTLIARRRHQNTTGCWNSPQTALSAATISPTVQ